MGDVVASDLEMLRDVVAVQQEVLAAEAAAVQHELHQVKVMLVEALLVLLDSDAVRLLGVVPHGGHFKPVPAHLAGGPHRVAHAAADPRPADLLLVLLPLVLQ